MAFSDELDNELTRRLDAAARLVEDAQVKDVEAARWFAMQLEVNAALKDAIVEIAKRLEQTSAADGE
ncbi:MAG: hypothetical protein ACLQBB_06705 [Solirubrobacteraceae bacterium]